MIAVPMVACVVSYSIAKVSFTYFEQPLRSVGLENGRENSGGRSHGDITLKYRKRQRFQYVPFYNFHAISRLRAERLAVSRAAEVSEWFTNFLPSPKLQTRKSYEDELLFTSRGTLHPR
jgi:hypothetical protein